MKINELRIGNWIKHKNGTLVQVESISEKGVNYLFFAGGYGDGGSLDWEPMDNFSPVRLTPKILEKCGFTKGKSSNEYWTFWGLDNGWYISQAHKDEESAGVEVGKFYWGDITFWQSEVTSLSHLQNLYYFLTSKELEIKL